MAETTNCPTCEGLVSSQAKACPHCGQPGPFTKRSEAIPADSDAESDRRDHVQGDADSPPRNSQSEDKPGTGQQQEVRRPPSKRRVMIPALIGCAALAVGGVLLIMLVLALRGGAEPTYIKTVAAYPEGDGMYAYIVLVCSDGRECKADGLVSVVFYEQTLGFDAQAGAVTEYSMVHATPVTEVSRSDFTRTTVGVGEFEHEVLMLGLGHFSYSDFGRWPKQPMGTIRVDWWNHLPQDYGQVNQRDPHDAQLTSDLQAIEAIYF